MTDHLTQEAATGIARTIERYWSRRGYDDVAAWAEPVGGNYSQSNYQVRSNLVRGLPPSFRKADLVRMGRGRG